MSREVDTVVDAYFAQLAPEAKPDESVKQAVTLYRDRIDFKAPRTLILQSTGNVSVRMRGLNPNELFDL